MTENFTRIIQQQLEQTKDRLENVDDTLRKLTGREITNRRPGDQRRVSVGGQAQRGGRGRGMAANRKDPFQRLGAPPAKRPLPSSAFSRLGKRVRSPEASDEDEEPESKPAIQSSVVATGTTPVVRSREDTLTAQNKDSKGKARNKRMFGLLLGTLQKFKQEATETNEKVTRRIEIEKKLDEKAEEEKKQAAHERKELFDERRQNMKKMAELEQLMELAKEQQEWDKHTRQLTRFIRTKAKPHIFYRPSKHAEVTDKKHQETRDFFHGMIRKRKEELDQKLAEISAAKDLKKARVSTTEEPQEGKELRDKENRKRRISSDVKGKDEVTRRNRDRKLSESRRRRRSQDRSRERNSLERRRERRSSGKSRRSSALQQESKAPKSDTAPAETEPDQTSAENKEDGEEEGGVKIKEEEQATIVEAEAETNQDQSQEVEEGKTGKDDGVDVGTGIEVVIGGRVEGQGASEEGEGNSSHSNSAWGTEGWNLNEIPLPQRESAAVEVKVQENPETEKEGEQGVDYQMGGPDEPLDYNEMME